MNHTICSLKIGGRTWMVTECDGPDGVEVDSSLMRIWIGSRTIRESGPLGLIRLLAEAIEETEVSDLIVCTHCTALIPPRQVLRHLWESHGEYEYDTPPTRWQRFKWWMHRRVSRKPIAPRNAGGAA